jgi:hypothetical protein
LLPARTNLVAAGRGGRAPIRALEQIVSGAEIKPLRRAPERQLVQALQEACARLYDET